MAPAVAIFVLCVVSVAVVRAQWVNNYDGDARLECNGNQLMSFLGSVHNNHHEDRIWQFQCKQAPGSVTDCHWTDFLNGFDQALLFNCPGDEVLNGMYSYHNNHHEDRRFQVKCCKVVTKSTRNCYFTNYINDWDGVMQFNVPSGWYIKGVSSQHDNKKEDRRWKLNLCKLQ